MSKNILVPSFGNATSTTIKVNYIGNSDDVGYIVNWENYNNSNDKGNSGLISNIGEGKKTYTARNLSSNSTYKFTFIQIFADYTTEKIESTINQKTLAQ